MGLTGGGDSIANRRVNEMRIFPREDMADAKPVKKQPRLIKSWLKMNLLFLKIIVIVVCVAFIIQGWHSSIKKYLEHQTSISTVINNTDMFTYPSVTLCHKFKYNIALHNRIAREMRNSNKSIEEIDVEAIIDEISWRKTDFLTLFSHPRHGNLRRGVGTLYNDSLWTTSVPHQTASGRCYTYDPPFQSKSSLRFGIRIAIKLPNTRNVDQSVKENRLRKSLAIFLHKKGAFTFYRLDDRPNMNLLDNAGFGFRKVTSIDLSYSKLTRLSSDSEPCESDPNYKVNECIEKHYTRRRGCHAPWNAFDDVDGLPMCANMSIWNADKAGSFQNNDFYRHRFSNWAISKATKCKMPCTSSRYDMHVSHYGFDWARQLDKDSDWTLNIWFKNFEARYDGEYVVCDWTCLVGEIGGSLGFFLGGSILAYVNVIVDQLMRKVD